LVCRRKEENLEHGSLMRSIEFIVKFIMKLSSSGALTSFILFSDLLGLENSFNGLGDEI